MLNPIVTGVLSKNRVLIRFNYLHLFLNKSLQTIIFSYYYSAIMILSALRSGSAAPHSN